MSLIHRSQGSLSPAGEALLSEPAIAARIGKALFGNSERFRWDDWENDYASIRDAIESVLPIFEHYNDRVRGDGFNLPHTAARREWKTPSGKAEFRPTPTPVIRLRDGELRLMTIRSHDQYNTTVYGRNDRYRGIANRRNVIFMNGDDMDARHLMPGDEVVVTSTDEAGIVRTQKDLRVVRYDIPRGACASYFPESNVLIPIEAASAVSNQPVSKMIPVRVERVRR